MISVILSVYFGYTSGHEWMTLLKNPAAPRVGIFAAFRQAAGYTSAVSGQHLLVI